MDKQEKEGDIGEKPGWKKAGRGRRLSELGDAKLVTRRSIERRSLVTVVASLHIGSTNSQLAQREAAEAGLDLVSVGAVGAAVLVGTL